MIRMNNYFMKRRLNYELKLIKPIYEILNDRKEIFEKHWQERSTEYDLLRFEDVEDIIIYTEQKLIELQKYFGTVKENKRTKICLQFYKDHVEILMRYHQNKFESYPGTYMYIYSELLLGAQRYQNIENATNSL